MTQSQLKNSVLHRLQISGGRLSRPEIIAWVVATTGAGHSTVKKVINLLVLEGRIRSIGKIQGARHRCGGRKATEWFEMAPSHQALSR